MRITKKIRKELLDMGFPRQTINNWTSGRVKPSRLSREVLRELRHRAVTLSAPTTPPLNPPMR